MDDLQPDEASASALVAAAAAAPGGDGAARVRAALLDTHSLLGLKERASALFSLLAVDGRAVELRTLRDALRRAQPGDELAPATTRARLAAVLEADAAPEVAPLTAAEFDGYLTEVRSAHAALLFNASAAAPQPLTAARPARLALPAPLLAQKTPQLASKAFVPLPEVISELAAHACAEPPTAALGRALSTGGGARGEPGVPEPHPRPPRVTELESCPGASGAVSSSQPEAPAEAAEGGGGAQSEAAALEAVFHAFDTDHDGFLNFAEARLFCVCWLCP
jgi:hypothetical protein